MKGAIGRRRVGAAPKSGRFTTPKNSSFSIDKIRVRCPARPVDGRGAFIAEAALTEAVFRVGNANPGSNGKEGMTTNGV